MRAEAPADTTVHRGPDRCPRCGGAFTCGMTGAAPCPCATVTLPAERLHALRQRYQGCLCLACLQALAQGAPMGAASQVDGP